MSLVIGRAPLRLPLAGGLTDIPDFLDEDTGRTVSAALSLHVYAQLKPNPAGTSSLHLNRETFRGPSLRTIPNELLASVLEVLDADLTQTDVYLMSDMPGSSGLGGSGAATVALVAALSRVLGRDESSRAILGAAAFAEVELLRNGGYHDTAIAALGGLRSISYGVQGVTEDSVLPERHGRDLLRRARMALLGSSASTAASLRELRGRLPQVRPLLREMASVAEELGRTLDEEPLARHHLALIRYSQDLKARVLGGTYLATSIELSEARNTSTTTVILPGGKLGSTMWLLSIDGNERDEGRTGPTRSWSVDLARGATVQEVP